MLSYRSLITPAIAVAFCATLVAVAGTPLLAEANAPSSSKVAAAEPAAAASGPRYVPIVEDFSAPAACTNAGSTLSIVSCAERRTLRVDVTVDALQRDRFDRAGTVAAKTTLLRNDAQWLKSRRDVCSSNPTGGTIDEINFATCQLAQSKTRAISLINKI